jgi:hypothetical protein
MRVPEHRMAPTRTTGGFYAAENIDMRYLAVPCLGL